MKIRYRPRFDAFPSIEKVKPFVPPHYRELARQSPPPALPTHCKPWVDANSFGLLLRYPYQATLTVEGRADAPPICRVTPRHAQLVYGPFVQLFAKGHFGIASGYYFTTDPGIGIYTANLPYGQTSKVRLVPGLVECWRFPKSLFIVVEAPPPGDILILEYGDPLCVLMPVAAESVVGELMSDDEWHAFGRQREAWDAHLESHPELRWTSAEGIEFTHMYKVFQKHRASAEEHSERPD